MKPLFVYASCKIDRPQRFARLRRAIRSMLFRKRQPRKTSIVFMGAHEPTRQRQAA